MYRVDGPGKVGAPPAPAAAAGGGYFTEGDPIGGVAPTAVTADWLNAVQDELTSLVVADGQALDKLNNGQVLAAVGGALGAKASDTDTNSVTTTRTRLVAASETSRANGAASMAAASRNSTVSGAQAAAVAAAGATVSGTRGLVAAANDSGATGTNAAVVGCDDCDATVPEAVVVASVRTNAQGALSSVKLAGACQDSTLSGSTAALFGATHTELDKSLSVAGGYDPSGTPSTSTNNQTWRIESKDTTGGASHGRAIFEGGTSAGPADYAEYFENETLGVIPPATLVSRRGRLVRPAGPGDRVLGIVSTKPAVVGNAAPFEWSGRWARDELGRPLLEEVPFVKSPGYDGPLASAPQPVPEGAEQSTRRDKRVVEELDDKGRTKHKVEVVEVDWVTWPAYEGPAAGAPAALHPQAEHYTGKVQVQAPEYDPEQPYTPREQRPEEWTCVGLLGQLPVRVDATVRPDDFVEPTAEGLGGRAPKETRIECMELLSEYDEARGYAVALCLLR